MDNLLRKKKIKRSLQLNPIPFATPYAWQISGPKIKNMPKLKTLFHPKKKSMENMNELNGKKQCKNTRTYPRQENKQHKQDLAT